MSEQEEDFAAMFEASVKARRFERGQTIEGTIVGVRSEGGLRQRRRQGRGRRSTSRS